MRELSQARKWQLTSVGVVLTLGAAAGWGEHQGWPWLVQPVSHAVSGLLGRQVTVGSADQQASIHFWGGLRFQAPIIKVASPAWAKNPDVLVVEDGELAVGYGALWRMARGGDIHLQTISARRLQAWLERDAQGKASWQFNEQKQSADASKPAAMPRIQVDAMFVEQALIKVDDELTELKATVTGHVLPVSLADKKDATLAWQFAALAEGSFRGSPLKATAKSTAPWQAPTAGTSGTVSWPIEIHMQLGRMKASFLGEALSSMLDGPIEGKFEVSGPSLAAVGAPFGVTLPTTAAFKMQGKVKSAGVTTHVEIASAHIGKSDLKGVFDHHRDQQPPVLTGRLQGQRLALVDLGPAIGVPTKSSQQDDTANKSKPEKMLPDKAFNLPSLAAMNADVAIDIDVFDTGNDWLKPMTALKGRILLNNSVLRLEKLSTRLASGQVKGLLSLDGRDASKAIFHADLDIEGVKLEQWISALQRDGSAPYLSGELAGRIDVTGQGVSTAQLLSTLDGKGEFVLTKGQMSHLAVELIGLDAMQGVMEWLKGDESLPIDCAHMVWTAKQGVLKPNPTIVSTRDSTLWAEGLVSIPDETFDLRARVAPKDFSLATLRTPIRVSGSWQQPTVQALNSSSWLRLLGSAALITVNPLAGILPLIDPGQRETAMQLDKRCRLTPAPR